MDDFETDDEVPAPSYRIAIGAKDGDDGALAPDVVKAIDGAIGSVVMETELGFDCDVTAEFESEQDGGEFLGYTIDFYTNLEPDELQRAFNDTLPFIKERLVQHIDTTLGTGRGGIN